MKVIGLDGREYVWAIHQHAVNNRKSSKLHQHARDILKEIFPFEQILEEVKLPGSSSPPLWADFFIPGPRLIIEVHGEQHYKFNNFHFKNKMEFFKAKARDNKKIEWCELNDIEVISLSYKEKDQWKKQIQDR